MSSLTIFIGGATNVPKERRVGFVGGGDSDPYVSLKFNGTEQKTKVIPSEENPQWNESLVFNVLTPPTASDNLLVSLYDYEKVGSDRFIGSGTIPLGDIVKKKTKDVPSLKLTDEEDSVIPNCTITKITITFSGADSGTAGQTGGGAADVIDMSDDDLDGNEADSGLLGGKKGGKRKKGSMGNTLTSDGVDRRKTLLKLGSKSSEFQVRVKIVEARQLQGANLNPVCRVICAKQSKQTRVKVATTDPYFNELFFFNMQMKPVEFLDQEIEFFLYDSRRLRSDALIGTFKGDVGIIYDQPQHALINKWLLISDPEDSMSGPRGYLKVCVAVMGPGDEAPSFKSASGDDDVDIEANVLKPAGVSLRPASFRLKVYRAEDIPQMDSEFFQAMSSIVSSKKERKPLVDPYVIFSFAGKEARTKVLYSTDQPEWNQELMVPMKFPSMCDKLHVKVVDFDKVGDDDNVAVSEMPVASISKNSDSGFLPTFGPCYLNLYGSTREFVNLPTSNDALNEGKGEGCAYRGRILIELETKIGDPPDFSHRELDADEINLVSKYQRRRKFRLHAYFLNATMIQENESSIAFEISMGNYGNQFDGEVQPSSSLTRPTRPLFDGCSYHFLPWGRSKPCAVVESHWEDISFRLEALNWLIKIKDTLEYNLGQIKISMDTKLPLSEQATLLVSALDQLLSMCKKPLPKLVSKIHNGNNLDALMRKCREAELQKIAEEAKNMRNNTTDMKEAVSGIEELLERLKSLIVEPQNSMPDVIIWMVSEARRIAYARIPAYELLYSENIDVRGKNCGMIQTITLRFPGKKADEEDELPALLRAKLWLGLEDYEQMWRKEEEDSKSDLGNITVVAETYENQQKIPLKGWGEAVSQPAWSDARRKKVLTKDSFIPPDGWKWDKDWYVYPELSLAFGSDGGHTEFSVGIYEFETQNPQTKSWIPNTPNFTDEYMAQIESKEKVELPEGWKWVSDWSFDMNRAVDENGWDYNTDLKETDGWASVEKMFHSFRRRRWVRVRKLTVDIKKLQNKVKEEQAKSDGWEYAPVFSATANFHSGPERTVDFVRRRRWHRRMIPDQEAIRRLTKEGKLFQGSACFFHVRGKTAAESHIIAPRMILHFKQKYKYQLRSYIFQARDLIAGDADGLSDPFAVISCLNASGKTEVIPKTLCPMWDQTLIFDEMEIQGDPDFVKKFPPTIVVEIFDDDMFGGPEFLGRIFTKPMVKLNSSDTRTPTLQWHTILHKGTESGEVLAAFEMFLISPEKDLPFLPPRRNDLYSVPSGIRPLMQRTGIEILCWGIRNMASFQFSSVNNPSVEFQIGSNILTSGIVKNAKKCPNFDENLLFFDCLLPKEDVYIPPMNIKVRDNRQFGRQPIVGMYVLRSLQAFRIATPTSDQDLPLSLPRERKKSSLLPNGETISGTLNKAKSSVLKLDWVKIPESVTAIIPGQDEIEDVAAEEEDIDWWSKYYASVGDMERCGNYLKLGYEKIEIYSTELENVQEFGGFKDLCETFDLVRGKALDSEEAQEIVGQVKAAFVSYPLSENSKEPLPPKIFRNLPPHQSQECIVRVYCVMAEDLAPADDNEIGKKKINNRDDYLPNTLTPEFGRMFELTATIPVENKLIVKVMDWDFISGDDTIGQTIIDLESRLLTKHRATCSLSRQYCVGGPLPWRDSQEPWDILVNFCLRFRLSPPIWHDVDSSIDTKPGIEVAGKIFNLSDFETDSMPIHGHCSPDPKQRLALHILHRYQQYVPEHVETRKLYNPLQPSIEQGKLLMWVDIFPKDLGVPPAPVSIEPRQPKKYELRVIIWNTKDVVLSETSVTGEAMSDIYVKGWMKGIEDDTQETDVHYRSTTGEGNFNWRFIFKFEYLPAEEKMIVRRKEHFWSLDVTEFKLPPILVIQIWDNDQFSADDFLGTCELDLSSMPKSARTEASCNEKMMDKSKTKSSQWLSLFKKKRVKGLWPFISKSTEEGDPTGLTGKVEMEIELLTEEEANSAPSGKAREEPNENPHLDPPKRPESSFLAFTNPWKTFKMIIWRRYRYSILTGLVIFFLILFVILFLYALPGVFAKKIVGG